MGRPRQGWRLRKPRREGDPYTVRFTDKEGRPRELSTATGDPGQAAIIGAELYARDLTRGITARPRVDPLLELDVLMATWLADLEKTHDPETVGTYTAYARGFIRHFGSVVRITHARMGDYQRGRLTQVLASTVRKERSAFNGFLSWCVEQGVMAEAEQPRWPKLPKKSPGVRSGAQRSEPVDITVEQANAFLAALPAWSRPRRGRSFAIRSRYEVMYETGLRPSTLDTLESPKHWRPGSKEVRIEDQHDKARFGRTVRITERARLALERTLAVTGPGVLFGVHDPRLSWDKARVAVGLPKGFAPYDLRHARIGHDVSRPGADVRGVMQLVGHLLMTTTNKYVRGDQAGAAKLIADRDFGEITGREGTTMSRAREGNRTPTGVTPLEPESQVTDQETNSYAHIDGQRNPEKGPQGHGFGGIPETEIPKSVSDAARYLAVLRASEEALEWALRDDLLEPEPQS